MGLRATLPQVAITVLLMMGLGAPAGAATPSEWVGTYTHVVDDGPNIGGGEILDRFKLVIGRNSCAYQNDQPHGAVEFLCTARVQDGKLAVFFKRYPPGADPRFLPHFHGRMLTLEHGPDNTIITTWEKPLDPTNRPPGVFFTR